MATSDKAGALNSLFSPFRWLNDRVYLTKANELGIVLKLEGIDYEALTDETLEDQHTRLVASEQPFDERFRTYQYLVKLERPKLAIDTEHPNPVVAKTLETRKRFLATKPEKLYSIELYRVILFNPGRWTSEEKLCEHAQTLLGAAESLQLNLADLLGISILGKLAAFRFFRLLASLNPAIADQEPLVYDDHLDYWMGVGCGLIGWTERGFTVGGRQTEVLTLRMQPRTTSPNVLRDLLKIRANFLVCTEWTREPIETTVTHINAAQQWFTFLKWVKNIPALVQLMFNRGQVDEKWSVPDKAKEDDVTELGDTLTRVRNKGDAMGYFALTACIFDDDQETLTSTVSQFVSAFGNLEGLLQRETDWALGAWAAIIPGTNPSHAFRQRHSDRLPLSQYADLSPMYRHREGSPINSHLQRQSLVVLETRDGTPIHFNLHVNASPNSFLLGVTGAGKTFLTNLLIDSAQQYNPFTFVLDIGGSYRHLSDKHGGVNLRMRFDESQSVWINPFYSQPSQRKKNELQFLYSFVRILLTNAGHHPTPKDDNLVYNAVKKARRLRELELPDDLMIPLSAWIYDGRYSSVFDNEDDTLALARFQTFDFQDLEIYPEVMEPLLFYVLQRINQIVRDPALVTTWKHAWADEVYRFLLNETARRWLIGAGQTWRLHNGGISLVTQAATQFQQTEVLDLVKELCQTQIFLPCPGAEREFYQKKFDFNDRVLDLFVGLRSNREFLWKTASQCNVLAVNVETPTQATYRNDPYFNAWRNEAVAEHGSLEAAVLAEKA